MAIDDKDIGFGESTVKRSEPRGYNYRRKVQFICENCGCKTIERSFYCTWDIEAQQWVLGSPNDDACDYCTECGGESYFNDEYVPLPTI